MVLIILTGILYGLIGYKGAVNIEEIAGRPLNITLLVKEELTSHIYKGEIISAVDMSNCMEIKGMKKMEAALLSNTELKKDMVYRLAVTISERNIRKNPGSYLIDDITLKMVKAETDGIEVLNHYRNNLHWINSMRDELDRYLKKGSKESGAFLSSIITGKRTGLNSKVKDSFSRTGLAHILSISGTHFGLLSTSVFFVIKGLISFLPHSTLRRLTIYLTPSQVSAILSLPFLVFYLLVSGASIPAIRSFIMINLFLLGLLINRRGYWLNSLLLAACLILVRDISCLGDISFQLSFLAVLFLGFSLKDGYYSELNQGEEKNSKGILNGLFSRFRKAFIMSLSVSFGTAPLVVYYFYYFSLISPIVNILLTPLICIILLPLALFSSFLFILTGHFPLEGLIFSLTDIILSSVKYLSSLPFSAILTGEIPLAPVIAFYAITIAIILRLESQAKGKDYQKIIRDIFPVLLLISSLLIVILPKILNKAITITFLDVGQGDCAVLETMDRGTFIIDTGKTGREVESYLRFRGKDTIEAIIITHHDNDHSGGVLRLLKRFKVKEIWDNGLLLYPDDMTTPVRHLERGDRINLRGIEMLILHPYKGFYSKSEGNGNDHSLVIKLKGQRLSLLLTGDIEEEAEEDLFHLNTWLRSKVIKIAHHGSRHSTGEAFLDAVSPEMAIISVGRGNPFGHPHEETLDRLNAHNLKVYRTDRDGAIKITESNGGLDIKTYNNFVLEKATGLGSELRNLAKIFQVW